VAFSIYDAGMHAPTGPALSRSSTTSRRSSRSAWPIACARVNGRC